MSIIENPVAYMNETNNLEYEEQTPMTKPETKQVKPTNLLDETPLTTEKNKELSPRQLNTDDSLTASEEPTLASVDLPDLSLSSQNDVDVSDPKPGKGKKLAVVKASILDLAETMPSDDSEDEEYVPGAGNEAAKEEEEDKEDKEEGEPLISRQYSLRDGVKGTAVEEVTEVTHGDPEKKKADDLWSAFKAEVAVPIKRKAKEFEATIREKTYDFAGEKVTVKEEVRNKRKSIVSSLGFDRKRRRESAPIVLSRPPTVEEEPSGSGTSTAAAQTGEKRARPVSKLNSLVNRLTKRPKMTVLNKTALDWDQYKTDNKISDDVKNEAKAEGYVEKQDFLSRADQRQFELEREIRAQQARRRAMMGSKQF